MYATSFCFLITFTDIDSSIRAWYENIKKNTKASRQDVKTLETTTKIKPT